MKNLLQLHKTVDLIPQHDLVELKGTYEELTLKSFYENTTWQEDYFYAEKEGKKHASLWVNLLCGSLAIYSLLRPGKLNQSCGSNPPTAAFFRLLCFVHLPQKVRGIFALKMRKTGLGLAVIAIPKPVFPDFTVFSLFQP